MFNFTGSSLKGRTKDLNKNCSNRKIPPPLPTKPPAYSPIYGSHNDSLSVKEDAIHNVNGKYHKIKNLFGHINKEYLKIPPNFTESLC